MIISGSGRQGIPGKDLQVHITPAIIRKTFSCSISYSINLKVNSVRIV